MPAKFIAHAWRYDHCGAPSEKLSNENQKLAAAILIRVNAVKRQAAFAGVACRNEPTG
jgi:hypothetical protein